MSDVVTATANTAALRPRKATAADLPAIADTLAQAFYDDPVVTWCLPDDARRRQICPAFFGAVAESYLPYDQTYAVDEVVSAALWSPPAATDDEQLPTVLAEILQQDAQRAFEVFRLMEEKHPQEPHYYLFFLGTRPRWQGLGIGSSLMAPVLEMCDRDRMPAYLEASSERSVPLYLRNGFEIAGEIQIPDGPRMWPMWRAPR